MNTYRCVIDSVKECDYEEIKNLYMNEEVRKFLGGPVSSKIYDICFDEIINNTDDSFYWTVRKKDTNEFIALISLDSHHDRFSKEISYQFMPKFWGNGYAKEVVGAIIDYSFKNLNIEKVVAETQASNLRSCKLLRKLGMTIEETMIRFGENQYIFSIKKLNESF